MRFWSRHIFLVLLCVVLPLGAALYFDAQREVERVRLAGAASARLGAQALRQRLTLEAHKEVSQAISLAQTMRNDEALDSLARGKSGEAYARVQQVLQAAAPANGFVWLADATGKVVAGSDMPEPPEAMISVAGHPMFEATQDGYALDGFWRVVGRVELAAAAPVLSQGNAVGAVLVVHKIDDKWLAPLATSLGSNLTLVLGGDVVATTLDGATASEVAEASKTATEPVLAGRLEAPLEGGKYLPFLPLFIDKDADGLAFSSMPVEAQGAPPNLRWVVTVDAALGLGDLGARQEVIMGVLFAALLLAFLIGLVNYRTFVSPIERVAAHLSEIQLGRGDLELAEDRVSKPYRRLVRLINMTVQKMPARSLSALGSSSELSPSLNLNLSREPGPTGASSLLGMIPASPPAPAPMPPPPVPAPVPVPVAPPPPPPQAAPPPPPPAPSFAPITAAGGPPLLDDDEAEATDDDIEAAIKALEARTGGLDDLALTPPASSRSASEIRGRNVSSPFPVDEGSEFGRMRAPGPMNRPTPGGVRGGGSLDLSGGAGINQEYQDYQDHAEIDDGAFNPEATVVAPVQEELLARSARDEFGDAVPSITGDEKPDHTLVASVPPDLLAQSAREATGSMPALNMQDGLDAADRAHFKEVYERFIEMRRRCGENTNDLAFDRFLAKLTRNRDTLMKKYACRTVRFQVYEKDGKAALKATPVRAR
ncbi:MAG: hypothetical protein H6730_17040 [Deltaproteobacteria bacterium]|nr:hypothetical protein [Deltaproteobacteria bacterium]